MIKKWIKIPNDIIQWTKKWHFFHFLAWAGAIPTFYMLFLIIKTPILLFLSIFDYSTDDIIEILSLDFEDVIFMYIICVIILNWIALFLSIIVVFIKFIFVRKITITNKFLLENKWYNIYYTISLISIAIVAILEHTT